MKKSSKRGRGRPPLSGEAGQRYQVTIPPRVAKTLRRHGKGSLSAGIGRNFAVARMEHLKETIRVNEKRIEMLESGKVASDLYPELGVRRAAVAEAKRLRQTNEELMSLIRQEEAWERRQKAFFAVHAQFLPHGNGQPDMESIDELEEAEKEWAAAQSEANRIVEEIRAGLRR